MVKRFFGILRFVCVWKPQVGIFDEPKKEAVKLYCPRCSDVYNTVSPYGGEREYASAP